MGDFPGVQLGIFKGRSPIHEKGKLPLFKEDSIFKYCFVDSYVEEIMCRCLLISENFWDHVPFYVRETPFCQDPSSGCKTANAAATAFCFLPLNVFFVNVGHSMKPTVKCF